MADSIMMSPSMIQENKDRNTKPTATAARRRRGVAQHDPGEQGSKHYAGLVDARPAAMSPSMIQENKDRNSASVPTV